MAKQTQIRNQLSVWKRISFSLVILTVLIAMFEVGLRIVIAFVNRHATLVNVLAQQTEVAGADVVMNQFRNPEVVHPFMGYVVDPNSATGHNKYGFPQIDGPILRRDSKRIIVAIFGGSVAKGLCEQSHQTLKSILQAALPDTDPYVVCLAQQGYRQPQQAMTLNFFQCLGAEFDVVVNLDGFNEAAIHPTENPDDDLWYGYPRNWMRRIPDVSNPKMAELVAEAHSIKTRRRLTAIQFHRMRSAPSAIIHYGWLALDQKYSIRHAEIMNDIVAEQLRVEQRHANTGPVEKFASKRDRFVAQARFWAEASRQMSRLCEAQGVEYLHFLQPNRHVPGSKPLTNAERNLAASGANYQAAIEEGYDHFATAGEQLKASGIDFHDLRMMFRDSTETLYSDWCCHFNQAGYDQIAKVIAEAIIQHRRIPRTDQQ